MKILGAVSVAESEADVCVQASHMEEATEMSLSQEYS